MGGDFESDNYEFGREKKSIKTTTIVYTHTHTHTHVGMYIILYLRGDDNKEHIYYFLCLEVVKNTHV